MSDEKTVSSISRHYHESAAEKLSNEAFAEYENKSSVLEEQAFRGEYPEFGGTVFLRFSSVEHWFEHRLHGLLEDLLEHDNKPDEPPLDLHNELN